MLTKSLIALACALCAVQPVRAERALPSDLLQQTPTDRPAVPVSGIVYFGAQSPFHQQDPFAASAPGGTRQGGETCASAVIIPLLPYANTGTTCGYIDDVTPSCGGGGAGSPDVFYSYTPAVNETICVSLCGSAYNTVLAIYVGATEVACNDDFCGSQSEINNFPVLAGTTYCIAVDGYGSGSCGSYSILVTNCNGCVLTCPGGSLMEGEPLCGAGYYDVHNGGCNSSGVQPIAPQSGGSATMCGQSGTYLYGGIPYRDTDWYECCAVGGVVTVSCLAEFPLQVALFYSMNCAAPLYDVVNGPDCTTLTLSRAYSPGEKFWIWVGPANFTGVPCAADYVLDVSGIQDCPSWHSPWQGHVVLGGCGGVSFDYLVHGPLVSPLVHNYASGPPWSAAITYSETASYSGPDAVTISGFSQHTCAPHPGEAPSGIGIPYNLSLSSAGLAPFASVGTAVQAKVPHCCPGPPDHSDRFISAASGSAGPLGNNFAQYIHIAMTRHRPFPPQPGRDMEGSAWTAGLVGSHEVPPNQSEAAGTAVFDIDGGAGTCTMLLVVRGLTYGQVTGLRLHQGAAGEDGPVVLDLLPGALYEEGPDGDVALQVLDLDFPPELIPELEVGNLYLNVTSLAYPAGELRGQLGSVPDVSSAPEPPVAASSDGEMLLASPSPANPRDVTVSYRVAESGQVTLKLIDASGRLVKTLVNAYQEASSQPRRITWDGRDESGQLVGSGVLFCQLESPGFRTTKKLVMVK